MAEELQDKDASNDKAMDVAVDIETKIYNAMRSRVSYFKEEADSLTFEGVRRLLEKDLCMEMYTLDVHKRLVKQCLVKCFEADWEDNVSKKSEETGRKSVNKEEAAEPLEGHQSKKGVKEPCSEDEEKMEDSPVMGLLIPRNTKNVESDGIKGIKDKDDKDIPSESIIAKAIRKRTSYLKANSEKVTMAGVRRLLEDDLKLTKNALDSCKKFISQQVEEILTSCEAAEQVSNEKRLKTPKKVSKESSHSTEGSSSEEDSEEENDEVKPGKKNATKGRIPNSNETKKRKRSTKETLSAKKQSKHVQHTSEEDNDEGGENVSEDGQSESSHERPVKKEVSTPVYGKHVEHLKSVIKSCGMSVPPSIYKKVKQAPESKRESQLIKELEGILSREGLSANPTEKEIKEVKKKKERAKELEGIDLSNIVSSSRRRSATSYATPPPKPKIPVKTDGDGDDGDDTEEEEEEDEDEEDDDDEEEEDGEEEDNGNVDGSQDDNEDSD
ncbi:glutamic acid-rich protein isoform X2 [Benincasa hispida]|uniref:glutamic acid-rich protein isoform X2 n=1 Tax=Benincasa hispida TaxID=102211 RepID=UPI001900E96E|nr:glutamic acid-rich protein isoform X2 [Benincasa hispida]